MEIQNPAASESDCIAFYGSLMAGFGALRDLGVAGDFEFVSACRLRGRLFDLGQYPGVIECGDDLVTGELYRIKNLRGLAVLDEYEGFDPEEPERSPFFRSAVVLADPAGVESWMYFYRWPVAESQRVASGDWAAHVATRRG